MRRRTFDSLMSLAGLALVVVLAVAGGLLTWAHNYVNTQVYDQLAAQKIYFPPANSPAVAGAAFAPMRQYGGQLMTTGAQAEVYADHFIANHLKEVAGGKTYSQVSAEAQAQPHNAALAAQAQTLFQGTTLRGMLLDAYAFSQMGVIAGIAAIVAYCGAAVMLVLSALGLYHARRTDPARELQLGVTRPEVQAV